MNRWKMVEPYFHRVGLFSYQQEKYQGDIDKMFELCNDIGIPPKVYLDGAFYPRFSEGYTNFRIRPHHLHSKWVLEKVADYLRMGKNKSAYIMEKFYIERTKNHIHSLGMTEEEYFTGGLLIPPVLDDIKKKHVSLIYCCANNQFRDMYSLLPQDIKDEYFYEIDVYFIYKQIRLNKTLMEVINE